MKTEKKSEFFYSAAAHRRVRCLIFAIPHGGWGMGQVVERFIMLQGQALRSWSTGCVRKEKCLCLWRRVCVEVRVQVSVQVVMYVRVPFSSPFEACTGVCPLEREKSLPVF